ncbi:3-deoxy-manno-octulosonate cytidylyltransferase [Serratia symbiotica str. 'Cinara cedri']|nr:3-deoxy-manno-octulosonate cytidylyltransferase [Serratia symbiotica str. 'Cinara cedri']
MSFIVIIPARYASTRLPAKPLIDINGIPLVVRVMNQAHKSGANRVIVAVDHPEVAKIVQAAGGEICMTRIDHQSGTERLAEVIEVYNFPDDQIIVNLQGDEPLISPLIIRNMVENLITSSISIVTLATPINSAEDALNPNVVKAVIDNQGYALYFSRAPIPWNFNRLTLSQDFICDALLRHIGIYAYRAGFIRRYISWQPSQLEQIESLEQLRILWYGEKISVAVTKVTVAVGIDTLEDLQRIRDILY